MSEKTSVLWSGIAGLANRLCCCEPIAAAADGLDGAADMPTVRRTSVSARTQGSGTAATGHQRGHQPGDGSATAGAGGPSLHADPAIPKHIAISYASCEHELVHETVVLIFSFSAFAMQILHLYRTVWWLPQSYTHFALVNNSLP